MVDFRHLFYFFPLCFIYFFIYLLYNIVLVLPYFSMNPPRVSLLWKNNAEAFIQPPGRKSDRSLISIKNESTSAKKSVINVLNNFVIFFKLWDVWFVSALKQLHIPFCICRTKKLSSQTYLNIKTVFKIKTQ